MLITQIFSSSPLLIPLYSAIKFLFPPSISNCLHIFLSSFLYPFCSAFMLNSLPLSARSSFLGYGTSIYLLSLTSFTSSLSTDNPPLFSSPSCRPPASLHRSISHVWTLSFSTTNNTTSSTCLLFYQLMCLPHCFFHLLP